MKGTWSIEVSLKSLQLCRYFSSCICSHCLFYRSYRVQHFPCFGFLCEDLLTIPVLKDLPAVAVLLLGSCLERRGVGLTAAAIGRGVLSWAMCVGGEFEMEQGCDAHKGRFWKEL